MRLRAGCARTFSQSSSDEFKTGQQAVVVEPRRALAVPCRVLQSIDFLPRGRGRRLFPPSFRSAVLVEEWQAVWFVDYASEWLPAAETVEMRRDGTAALLLRDDGVAYFLTVEWRGRWEILSTPGAKK